MSGRIPSNSTPPSFKLWSPAVDFIENRMWQYHPAFNTQGFSYSPSQGQFVAVAPVPTSRASSSLALPNVSTPPQPRPSPQSINDMEFWSEVFPRAMKQLKATSASGQGSSRDWGIRHLSNWPDVQAKLEMARRDYDFDHDQQHVGKFRKKVRGALDKSAVPLQQAVKLIPSGDVASPITKVADLLLDAYRQAAEVRNDVAIGFDDLPAFFASADLYFKIYPGDQNILKASIDFVLATLQAIEEAVKFYTSKQAKRAGLAILTGPQYQEKLSKSLVEMKSSADKLVSQARDSFQHRVIADGMQNRQLHAATRQQNGATHQALMAIYQQGQAGATELAWMRNMLNAVLGLLEDKTNNWLPCSPIPSRPTTPMPQEALPWTPQDLWAQLQIPNIDETDLQKALNSAADVLFADRSRAEQMIETHHFRNWITSAGSARLLVHGDFDPTNRTSPFTILCATIVKGLRMSPGVVSLVFFCGYHLRRDEHRGGASMIRSLIAQLLRQFPSPAIEPDSNLSTNDIAQGHISCLCKLFTHLIRKLPPKTTVFCFIDGINEYEREAYLHGMDEVIVSLSNLVDDDSRARLKLLLTSPQPTVEVRRAFDDETLLHMHQLPLIEEEMSYARLQERLAPGVETGAETDSD